MERPRIKDYKKDGNTYYHKSTKQNFEFDMSKYLNIVESGYRSQLKEYKKDVADWKLHHDALQSQLKERDELLDDVLNCIQILDDVLNYIQNSDNGYFFSLATRIRNLKN